MCLTMAKSAYTSDPDAELVMCQSYALCTLTLLTLLPLVESALVQEVHELRGVIAALWELLQLDAGRSCITVQSP